MSSSLVRDLARYRAGAVPAIGEVQFALDPPGGRWVVAAPVLAEDFVRVPDPRRAAGRRYDLVFLLSIVVMAVLAGATSVSGIRRWASGVDPAVLTALARGRPITVPVVSTFSRLLARVDGDAVDDAFARYAAAVLAPGDPDPFPQNLFDEPDDTTGADDTTRAVESAGVLEAAGAASGSRVAAGAGLRVASLDGKCVRGAVTATRKAPYLVSVFRQDTKTVAAQRQVDVKSNEITVFRSVFDVIPDLTGHVVVADALHTQREHARYLHRRDAFYLFPVAQNQPKLFAAVNALPWETTPVGYAEEGKTHGSVPVALHGSWPQPATRPSALARSAGWTNTAQATDHYSHHPTDALQLLGLTM